MTARFNIAMFALPTFFDPQPLHCILIAMVSKWAPIIDLTPELNNKVREFKKLQSFCY